MSDQKENQISNGNEIVSCHCDHDEYQYINLIKNIIQTGKFDKTIFFRCCLLL